MKHLLILLLFPFILLSQDQCKYTYNATVLECYDADTCTYLIDLGLGIQIKRKGRFYGVNTYEVRGSEKEKGIIARDTVRSLIVGKEITIQTIKDKSGKYGRILLINYVDIDGDGAEENLNEWLIINGHGIEYMKN